MASFPLREVISLNCPHRSEFQVVANLKKCMSFVREYKEVAARFGGQQEFAAEIRLTLNQLLPTTFGHDN